MEFQGNLRFSRDLRDGSGDIRFQGELGEASEYSKAFSDFQRGFKD